MKILLTISFVVLIELVCLTQTTLSQFTQCLEYLSIFNRNETRIVHCPMVTSNNKRQTKPTLDNMFIIDFHCLINDQMLCKKVEKVFITAGKFITATINLKSPVSVNATFLNLCEIRGGCTANRKILGAAGPARMVPNIDPIDNKMRLYPQALHKQMNLPQHPEYVSNDIMAMFNSNATYWFEGDPFPLQGKVDMLYIVLHELVHGLGFANSWNDYFGLQALTPFVGSKLTPALRGTGQFLEIISDKYLVLLPSGIPLTSITDELNKFTINLSSDFLTSFRASPQFLIAKNMYENATTPGTIGFLITPNFPLNTQLTKDQIQNNFVILETSLFPFQPSSSIGHVDLETYLHSSDFLMMYVYPKTATLGGLMSRAGSTNTTGPIGPKLRLLLASLGYEIKKEYVPPVTLSDLQPDDNNSDPFNPSNPPNNNKIKKSNSSFISPNIVFSLVCVSLTFTYNIIKRIT